ncbi:hypothetical protein [Arthrobacter sp. MYb222]|uniref:hypothetical protein n=1 Tax=Arthrobacter sp. MYb222 TaxID=1848599 RepID=UPI0011B02D3F|nr:hypothetical protein [Arthrobacter sp. MYb222]
MKQSLSVDDLTYARGFVVTKGAPAYVPNGWKSFSFRNWNINYDDRLEIYFAGKTDQLTVLLGEAIDSQTGIHGHSLVSILANADKPHLEEVLESVTGRHALFTFGRVNEVRQDSAGMRSVYFGEGVVASHAKLAALQIGLAPSVFTVEYMKANDLACTPGNYTEFRDVRVLTPNLVLDIDSLSVRRIYGGSLTRELKSDEAASFVIETSKNQLAWLAKKKPIVSLSAGLDSRTTVALLAPLRENLTAFSYESGAEKTSSLSSHDVEVAKQISEVFNIPFEIINFASEIVSKDVMLVMKNNHYKAHSRKLALAYLRRVSGRMNIRSNVYGIGRDTYGKRNIDINDGVGMCRLANGSKNRDALAINAFNEFIDYTSFPLKADVLAKDLFLWEHRIGVWQSAIYAESDLSHSSHVLINNLHCLKSLLSVSLEKRREGTVQKKIIREVSPELTSFEVNGSPF